MTDDIAVHDDLSRTDSNHTESNRIDPNHTDVDDTDLGIDVATAPELEDAELEAVLEALLLVVDTPVTVDALATATEQPAYRIVTKLTQMAAELAERGSGID
ncbi:SMC-Scp complex subunit ScpB, partial [Mycolicibacterium sp. KC 300]|nr:SMC-Scp complex subunit ScpB [Mycolicibacterium arseniciresistens]